MAVASLALIVLSLLLGSGVGLPISLPPAEPDPMLDKLAPPECLLFTCWSGWKAPDGDSKNATERLFAEPEIRRLMEQFDTELRSVLLRSEFDREAAVAARILPPAVRVLMTRPLAMYVSEFQAVRGEDPKIRGALIVNLGPLRGEVAGLLARIPKDEVEAVTIAGTPFLRWRQDADPNSLGVTFGLHGNYLIAGIGAGEVESLLKRAAGQPPAWLTKLRQRFDVDRVATVSYVDLAGARRAAEPMWGRMGSQLLDAMGLSNLDELVTVTGLDETGYVGISALDLDGPPQGLVRSLAGEPLKASDLAVIPRDPYLAMAVRLDIRKLVEEGIELAASVNPRAAEDLNSGLGQIGEVIGMRVREEFLASLGDVWTLHAAPEDGGLLTGWTVTVPVRNKGKVQLALALERARQAALAQQRGRRAPRIVWSQFGGEDIYTLSIPDDDFPIAPAYCVTDTHLVAALFPQAIKSFLLRRESKDTLAEAPRVAEQLSRPNGPLTLTYINNKRMLEVLYPFVQIGLRMANGQLARDDAQLDYTLLPSLTSITRHVGSGVTVTRRTESGFEFEQRQTLPGGSAAAAAPIGVAVMLPMIAESRRFRSINNLKQIAIAAHNFHDTHRSFPPIYNTDRNGKPLLSWRVYLLPYVEQQPLFDQFRLDEPWDSEHNKRLIAHMPASYRSPVSKAPPGMTTYLAVAGKHAVFQPPKPNDNGKTFFRASSIAEVRDGTSNTIMVLEVKDQNAVTWTKPDDYKYSTQDPGKGLFGAYRGGFNAAFTDASVKFLPPQVTKQTLNALLTRDGREVVDFRER